ncbi:hypothetical protein [Amnimonas aquatica]|uniref:Uncharacterized protein n=1 Tax=Amnimonas aquatica TaxID=2094561 RepID=A0A2P6ATF3_9GAMM|nr:hypothetical protein [Amnimonas aquatica]PQA47669.1 hypothetical protein C5O18_03940 [Amnimonas aquatica]
MNKLLAASLMTCMAATAHAEQAASPWSGLFGAAANIAAQKAGLGNNAAVQQAAAAAVNANAGLGNDPATIQRNLALALAAQAQASGQALNPAQQKALSDALASSGAQSLTLAQQQALLKQGMTPQQVQALAQLQSMNGAQLQALAQAQVNSLTPEQRRQYEAAQAQAIAQAQLQAQQAAAGPCQPVAQSKSGGLGGMFGKMAGGMLKSGLIPGVSAETANAAAQLAENAGAMADCVPAN